MSQHSIKELTASRTRSLQPWKVLGIQAGQQQQSARQPSHRNNLLDIIPHLHLSIHDESCSMLRPPVSQCWIGEQNNGLLHNFVGNLSCSANQSCARHCALYSAIVANFLETLLADRALLQLHYVGRQTSQQRVHFMSAQAAFSYSEGHVGNKAGAACIASQFFSCCMTRGCMQNSIQISAGMLS